MSQLIKKRIFILEDDDELRELFTILLEGESFEVIAFPTVHSFKKGLAAAQPDLIIMDVMLPDGNGLDLSIEVRNAHKTSNIPIIMMSAHQNFAKDKRNSPAEEFIVKPFDIEHLIERVSYFAYL